MKGFALLLLSSLLVACQHHPVRPEESLSCDADYFESQEAYLRDSLQLQDISQEVYDEGMRDITREREQCRNYD